MSLSILIVDDSKTARAIIAKTLAMCELPLGEVHQAGNGKEALDVLGDKWIDLVFADINMPVMNGVEMIERMGAQGQLQTIPVIIVSTDGSAARMEQLKSKGVRAFIHKPFAPENVRSIVQDVLGLKTGA